jgi:LPXTG-motif cell wall-anchored protein
VKARVAALATAVLTAAGMLAVFTPAASASSPYPGNAAFSGYSAGTMEHIHAVRPGTTNVVDVDAPFSGATFNSQGLGAGINMENPINAVIQPPTAGKNSYARTAGAEVGLGTDITKFPDQNQVILSKLLEASAPPSTDLIKDQLAEVPGDPLVYAKVAYERATANWSPDSCILGQPISYGENALAQAELLDAGTKNADNSMGKPVVSATPTGDPRTTNFSKSFTYLFPNGDGTFGVGSLTHMTLAPVTLFKGGLPDPSGLPEITIEFAGTWTLRAEASGKAGGSTVTYGVPDVAKGDPTPVVRVLVAGVEQGALTVDQLTGGGQHIAIPPDPATPKLLQIDLGLPEHNINGGVTSKSVSSKNGGDGGGTLASAASDIVHVSVLNAAPQLQLAEINVGHMEAKAIAPPGGVQCNIPVKKTATPDPVTAGQDFTWDISIPTSIDAFKGIDCDLTNIVATDTSTVLSGSPTAQITGVSPAPQSGQPSTGTVSKTSSFTTKWSLGNYKKGATPIAVQLKGHIPTTSGAGVLQNLVTITASLGNCKGGAAGQDLIGNAAVNGRAATVNGSAVVGSATVNGPNVQAAQALPARLAATGQNQPWLPVAGGGLLLGALALLRSRRRLKADPA